MDSSSCAPTQLPARRHAIIRNPNVFVDWISSPAGSANKPDAASAVAQGAVASAGKSYRGANAPPKQIRMILKNIT
jgi:hypothetical protein